MPETIESLLAEGRTFPPPESFKKNTLVAGTDVYDEADADFEGFWARQAAALDWFKDWHTILEWDAAVREVVRRRQAQRRVQLPRPSRHGRARRPGRVPLGGRARRHPHDHLRAAARRRQPARERAEGRSASARATASCIYLGMVPELPMALLACARIGAAHSVVFGGFSSDSLRDRIQDAEAKVLDHRRRRVAARRRSSR